MNEYTELLEKLVRCKSVTSDPAAVGEAEEIMRGFLEQHGIGCTMEFVCGRKVLYASTMPGKIQDFLFNAHLDVVPADDAMFEPAVEDGIIHCRGCHDCKGGAVAIAKILCELKGRASASAIFSADEEAGGDTTLGMVKLGYSAKKAIIIIDGSQNEIAYSQKGIVVAILTAKGRGGHASDPWAFDNPIDKLIDGYTKIRRAWPAAPADKWGDSMAATIISAGSVANQIPDTASMTLNIRFIRPGDEAGIVKWLGEISGLEISTGEICIPYSAPADTPLFTGLKKILEEKLPCKEIKLTRMLGATDARHFVSCGIPIAIIGLEGGGAHSVNEHLRLDSIREYADALSSYCLL